MKYILPFITILCIVSAVGSCNGKKVVEACNGYIQMGVDIDITEKALLYNDGVYPTDSLINRLRELRMERAKL